MVRRIAFSALLFVGAACIDDVTPEGNQACEAAVAITERDCLAPITMEDCLDGLASELRDLEDEGLSGDVALACMQQADDCNDLDDCGFLEVEEQPDDDD